MVHNKTGEKVSLSKISAVNFLLHYSLTASVSRRGQKYMCAANIINILGAQEFLVDVLIGIILLVHYHSQILEIYHIKNISVDLCYSLS